MKWIFVIVSAIYLLAQIEAYPRSVSYADAGALAETE